MKSQTEEQILLERKIFLNQEQMNLVGSHYQREGRNKEFFYIIKCVTS